LAFATKSILFGNLLSDSVYDEYKIEIRDVVKNKVYDFHKDSLIKTDIKKLLALYVKSYGDTLDIYYYYFPDQNLLLAKKAEILLEIESDSLWSELLNFASKLEGVKYTYAGEDPERGFDCSGFTKYVYHHIGIELPHNAQKQSELKGENKKLENAVAGDLIFFGSRSGGNTYTLHTGIVYSVMDDEIKVIHCVSGGVSIDGNNSSFDNYWKSKVLFVKTLPKVSP
jgi:hypothetical protein